MLVLDAQRVQRAFHRLHLPFTFSEQELETLTTTNVVLTDPVLLGFATPRLNDGINILNLRSLLGVESSRPPSFFDHPWYLDEAFGRTDCPPGWHFIQPDVDSDSIGQPHNYSYSLISKGLTLPTAIEVVLMLFLYFAETGKQLLTKKHTWCRDEASLNRFVTVGAFGRNGVFVSSHPGSYTSRGLGICGKLMVSPDEPFR